MPLFVYKAKTPEGKVVEDTLQASGRDNAATTLRSQGLEILTIKKVGGLNDILSRSISVSEKAAFCRFMATMLRSGMNLPDGVEIIRQETKSPRFQKILADVSYQTRKGKSLSAVLSDYKSDFDAVFLTLVRVGEESGTLEKTFDYLSSQLSASHELGQKIKSSLMYPAVVVAAMFGNGLLMAVFVLPRLSTAFLRLDVPLPAYTRVMLTIGEYFGKNTASVIVGAFAFLVISIGLLLIRPVRRFIIRFVSRVPVVRTVTREIDIARFARTLATLLKSGVPIIEALDVSAESITSPALREQAKAFSEGVSKGESLSDILVRKKKIFPVVLIQTIRAGEQSGSLEIVLDEVASFYEKEVDFSLKRLTGLIEPVLMLLIGVVVGIMVILMIAPIYSIVSGLQSTIQSQQ